MFGYEILRNQWVILVVFGGLAFVFYFMVHFYDYQKPRKRKQSNPEEYETEYMTARQAIPLSIKVLVTAILVFAIIFSIHAINHPQSW